MAEMGMRLDNFKFKLDKNVIHLQTYGGERTHCLCALYVRNIFTDQITSTFQELNGNEYRVLQQVHKYDGEIAFRDVNWMDEKKDVTRHELSGWDFSICTNLEKTPLYKHPMTRDQMRGFGYICVATLPLAGYPYLCENTPYVIICHKILSKVKNPITKSIASSSSVKNVDYLKSLEADLKNDLSDFSKEKVVLRVGEETEIVNKAILCARSPVFAKMFRNGTTELKMNTVTITDIKMPVLRALVSFLCSGLVSNCDFKFLCDLYCAAVKYDIMELH